jgi:hypothetical protein
VLITEFVTLHRNLVLFNLNTFFSRWINEVRWEKLQIKKIDYFLKARGKDFECIHHKEMVNV